MLAQLIKKSEELAKEKMLRYEEKRKANREAARQALRYSGECVECIERTSNPTAGLSVKLS